ncbi:hypothetical protein B0H67DRAFT_518816 [Lasiosphaeris hirsuta]|uniref:Vegetative incompatibility protein HET-E-1 n=1 Tax=Lasiosphaeris hirsuta TaxID=260670 RepID=A0AA40AA40_9PEZI|nr:hypothetical protein B0H67DRAFT_518816 [Lasiosphaeris hirsuta]
MRLLKTKTKELEFEEFAGRNVPLYSILSHTWGSDEISLQDIMGTRTLAAAHGFDYVWIDTCCIDKTSSAELSEAINSMYRWYQEADICYAYLADVAASPGAGLPARLSRSRWFTRGWTLQELLAPSAVIFLDAAWHEIGTKSDLHEALSEITGIPSAVLQGTSTPSSASVAQRMSWASKRETTRPEDLAYCLLGLFDVNMPMLYGEGDRAFARLQEEIIKTSDDHSIFAWDVTSSGAGAGDGDGPLATRPAAFANSGQFLPLDSSDPLVDAITVDSKGVHLRPDAVALEMAVHNGHEAVVSLLLDKGAKANLNVLLMAVMQGHEQVVELLLGKGVRPNLFIVRKAKELGNESVVRLLEEGIRSRAVAIT